MADAAAPRMILLPGEAAAAAAPGARLARQVRENVALEKLARALVEKRIRPETALREDVVADLSNWLRGMLAGPALPLNKERGFEEDALGSAELAADAEIFVEGHPGCPAGMARRNRRDGEKRRLYPDAGSRLRVREEVLRERCVALVGTFADKTNVADEGLRKKAANDFLRFWKEEILERRPASYNSYTGIEACMGDTRFLRRSEDVMRFSLGLTKDAPEAFVFLKSAPPPTHMKVVYALAMFLCLRTLPSLASIDEHATVETFTTSIFKEGPLALSPAALGNVRLSFAILCLLTTCEKIFVNRTEFKIVILPGSELRGGVIEMKGWRTQGFYTSWAWNLLGLSFLLGGLVPLLAEYGREDVLRDNPWILRAALVSFEVAAPSALLTSSVVTYALWPRAYADHGASGTTNFSSWVGLLQHCANTGMVLLETTLMGGLPVMLSHASFAPLFAGMYQSFLWWFMVNRWSPDHGPVYPYFFMDTTLGGRTTIFMIVLLAVIGFFFALFALLDMGMAAIEQGDHGAAPNVCCFIFMSYMLMKFKD